MADRVEKSSTLSRRDFMTKASVAMAAAATLAVITRNLSLIPGRLCSPGSGRLHVHSPPWLKAAVLGRKADPLPPAVEHYSILRSKPSLTHRVLGIRSIDAIRRCAILALDCL